jgi:transposase-like protein/IS1 family transposase
VPTCHCCSGECKKSGRFQNRNGIVQRYKCVRCDKSFSEIQPLEGIRVDRNKAVQVVEMLAETMGIRAAARLARLDKDTVLRILESAGEHCARFLDAKIRNIKVPFVQADEVFSYVQQKPNGKNEDDPNRGSMWTFLSIAKDEKLIINWRVGKRTGGEAQEFLSDLGSRMAERFQLTTDAFRGYVAVSGSSGAVKNILGDKCDYATETKHIKSDPHATGDRIYFAPKLVKVHRTPRFGSPDMGLATICHCERTNLSLRTFTRRFVRRTINFSKKTDNHRHAVALFAAHFNFCRVHKSLAGKTPAMAAGLTDHVWTVTELLAAQI